MFKRQLSRVMAASVGIIDRRVVMGFVMGVAVMFTGIAGSATGTQAAPSPKATSTLISQQSSVIADEIRADATRCAQGNTPGTIGHSVRNALTIHTTIAQASPRVDDLFGGDCFAGLSQLMDLSLSIPSLASIINAATNVVMQYLQNRICTAIQDVTGRATTPINNAINQINGLLGDLNGMTSGLSSGSWIGFKVAVPETTQLPANPYKGAQTDFGGGRPMAPDMSGVVQANAALAELNAVMGESETVQRQMEEARVALVACTAERGGDCKTQKDALSRAQAALGALNQRASNALRRASGLPPETATPSAPVPSATPVTPSKDQDGKKSEVERMGTLFGG